MNKSKLFQKV